MASSSAVLRCDVPPSRITPQAPMVTSVKSRVGAVSGGGAEGAGPQNTTRAETPARTPPGEEPRPGAGGGGGGGRANRAAIPSGWKPPPRGYGRWPPPRGGKQRLAPKKGVVCSTPPFSKGPPRAGRPLRRSSPPTRRPP